MQVLIVGAGVIGLAVARAAALRGHDVIVAEATGGIGNGVSSRNSEVVHAGIYYPTGSLRARHSTRGRRMLYDFCASHGVAYNKCGKLIVATDQAELGKVEALKAQGEANGVEGLELIGGNAARALEGELACIGALSSPESGIVDSHGYMRALWGELETCGGRIAFTTPVERLWFAADEWHVAFGGRDAGTVAFDAVVNSAGLGAQALARHIEGYPAKKIAPLVLAKGNYFRLRRKAGFFPAHLSNTGRRRARRPRYSRLGRPHALRAGRRMDRPRELHGGSTSRGCFLRPHSPLLAGCPRQLAGPRLLRHPSETHQAGSARRGFSDYRRSRARHETARLPIRHRVAWADLVALARRRHRRSHRLSNARRSSFLGCALRLDH